MWAVFLFVFVFFFVFVTLDRVETSLATTPYRIILN